MPVMPSRPTSMVRAECCALSERTVEVELWTVSPRPQTEPVSSSKSRSGAAWGRSGPRRVGGRGPPPRADGESVLLRGLSKPTTETTPSSWSSSRGGAWPAWGLASAEGLGVWSRMAASSSLTRSSSSLTSLEIAPCLELSSTMSSVTLAPEPLGLCGPRTEDEIVRMLLAVFNKERSRTTPPPELPPKRKPKSLRPPGKPSGAAWAWVATPAPPPTGGSRWPCCRMRSRLSCSRPVKAGAVPTCETESTASSMCDSCICVSVCVM
mmetsp:Transcript_18164/g.57158  ORF Transcript_18164/g.57158 Transcript_18164/m.57158 type:complete len:266 (+) Transcript_18164:416-1213(+)